MGYKDDQRLFNRMKGGGKQAGRWGLAEGVDARLSEASTVSTEQWPRRSSLFITYDKFYHFWT